jgi:hypothetical protein
LAGFESDVEDVIPLEMKIEGDRVQSKDGLATRLGPSLDVVDCGVVRAISLVGYTPAELCDLQLADHEIAPVVK